MSLYYQKMAVTSAQGSTDAKDSSVFLHCNGNSCVVFNGLM